MTLHFSGLAAAFVIAFAGHAASARDVHFVTEAYPPFNYREGTDYKGSSVDQVTTILKNTGINYTMEMMPWARAYALALGQPDYCVFTTVHNADRNDRFKWIEPLLKSRTVLIRKAGSGVDPKTLEDAKAFVVGTQRDDFTQTILEENHFPKIDLATDLDLTLKKLMGGRIDLMPISEKYYQTLRQQGEAVEATILLTESIYSIACNKSVPDDTIKLLQTKLDALIANGTQDALFRKYGLSKD